MDNAGKQSVDISAVDVPLNLTVAEINFVLTLAGAQPYNQVAGIVSKLKGQAEAYIAAMQQPPADGVAEGMALQ
jgi:hypothetical protein